MIEYLCPPSTRSTCTYRVPIRAASKSDDGMKPIGSKSEKMPPDELDEGE